MLMCLLWHTGKVERQYDEVGTRDLGVRTLQVRPATLYPRIFKYDSGPGTIEVGP